MLWKESRKGCINPMGEISNIGSQPRPDIVRLDGHRARQSTAYAIEHHPNDSRIKLKEDGICQTLNQRMGTGGGNVPLVLEVNESSNDDREYGTIRNDSRPSDTKD